MGALTGNATDNDTPYVFSDADAMIKSADLTVAGQMRDCAECHAGGGAMEYIPNGDPSKRTPYRNMAADGTLALVDTTQGNGVTNPITSLTSSTYTAFNYFIDIFDEDNDGDKTEVLENNYYRTGVMEVDCLICHLQGYEYAERKEAVRKGQFDVSRVVGAGIGRALMERDDASNNLYGRVVAYDDTKVFVDQSNNATYLAPYIAMQIKGMPPSKNCTNCHVQRPQSDWKKRGDFWGGDYEHEVHARLQCMGCHERREGLEVGTSGNSTSKLLGQCDPAKGIAPYSSVWNANDNTVRTCEYCHIEHKGGFFGKTAPDPTDKHYRAGLLAKICQDGGVYPMTLPPAFGGGTYDFRMPHDGVADASHLDIISCEACHVLKMGGHTGGALVDATGPDVEGRLADHENHYIERTMYKNGKPNLVYQWQRADFDGDGVKESKIIPSNLLTNMFWVNTTYPLDLNGDGTPSMTTTAGTRVYMDVILPTHIMGAGLTGVTQDGNFSESDMQAQANAIISYLNSLGVTTTGAVLKLNFFSAPFKVTHNIGPANQAWGANGCNDCHAPKAGFFNGDYRILPDHLEMGINATKWVDPLIYIANTDGTMGPGFSDVEGFHGMLAGYGYDYMFPWAAANATMVTDSCFGTLLDKSGYSVLNRVLTHTDDGNASASLLTAIDKSNFLYEDYPGSMIGMEFNPVDGSGNKGNTAGWVAYLESINGDAAHGVPPTITMISCNGTNATNFGANNATIQLSLGGPINSIACTVNATDTDMTGNAVAMSLDSSNTQWRIVPGSARPLQKVLNGNPVTIDFPAGADNNATVEVTVYITDSEGLKSFKNVTVRMD